MTKYILIFVTMLKSVLAQSAPDRANLKEIISHDGMQLTYIYADSNDEGIFYFFPNYFLISTEDEIEWSADEGHFEFKVIPQRPDHKVYEAFRKVYGSDKRLMIPTPQSAFINWDSFFLNRYEPSIFLGFDSLEDLDLGTELTVTQSLGFDLTINVDSSLMKSLRRRLSKGVGIQNQIELKYVNQDELGHLDYYLESIPFLLGDLDLCHFDKDHDCLR